MSPVCRIVVDAREPLDCIPRAPTDLGFEVVEERLPCGDYVLPNGVIVERKTVGGLNRSLVYGSFRRSSANCEAPHARRICSSKGQTCMQAAFLRAP
jgi:ERCC4-type nuclease